MYNDHDHFVLCSHPDVANRPSVLRSFDSIKQTASQTWCLIRFLPQLIGERVPVDHKGWHLYLMLRTIMDFVFAPKITISATFMLDGLMEDHHSMFMEVCSTCSKNSLFTENLQQRER